MKVKATINSWNFIPNNSGNLVRFDAVFATEKSTKIDTKSFKEIEFDVPIVNELEKYSADELKEELLRRENESPKPFVFCFKCKKPIFTKPVMYNFNKIWYYCERCNENV